MFGMVRELLETKDGKAFEKLYDRIEKYEGISDSMEIEIAKYLDQVSDAHLSDDTKAKIRAMLREILRDREHWRQLLQYLSHHQAQEGQQGGLH